MNWLVKGSGSSSGHPSTFLPVLHSSFSGVLRIQPASISFLELPILLSSYFIHWASLSLRYSMTEDMASFSLLIPKINTQASFILKILTLVSQEKQPVGSQRILHAHVTPSLIIPASQMARDPLQRVSFLEYSVYQTGSYLPNQLCREPGHREPLSSLDSEDDSSPCPSANPLSTLRFDGSTFSTLGTFFPRASKNISPGFRYFCSLFTFLQTPFVLCSHLFPGWVLSFVFYLYSATQRRQLHLIQSRVAFLCFNWRFFLLFFNFSIL